MKKLPLETMEACPPPQDLMESVKELRDAALGANNFNYSVVLSYVHAYLHWLHEHQIEIQEITRHGEVHFVETPTRPTSKTV